MKITPFFLFICAFCLFAMNAKAENNSLHSGPFPEVNHTTRQNNQPITGLITDQHGESIIGANIKVVGRDTGTITDIEGKFTLDVPLGSSLEISYIGYVSQTIVVNTSYIQVTLKEDTQNIEEIVVLGYQTQRKADLTGAVSVLDMSIPTSESNPNVLNSLQGKLAGVQIYTDAAPGGGGTAIRVRGMSTVNSNEPLYIIDGVSTTENMNSLNSNDIESIQVLKDASSASIYGSRAANGVVIITTKKRKR